VAEAEDVYKVSAEYDGKGAFDRFAADLEGISTDVQKALEGLVRAGAPKGRMAEMGGAAGKAYADAIRTAVTKGLQFLDDSVFGSSVARGSGLSRFEGGGRAFRQMEQAANRLKNQTLMDTWGRPNQDLQRYVDRLQEAERRTRQITAGNYSLLGMQERLQRIPTFTERETRALASAPLSDRTREALAQASAHTIAPTAYAAPPPRPFTPDLSGRNAPAQLFVRAINDESNTAPAKQKFMDAANQFGLTASEARKTAADYAELGKQIRAEAAAHKAQQEALQQARRADLDARTTRNSRSVQIRPGTDSWRSFDDPEMLAAAAAGQRATFGSYESNSPADVRRLRAAIQELGKLPVTLESLGLKSGESVRLGSGTAARQRQNYYLGSYRENIEATRLRELEEIRTRGQLPITAKSLGIEPGESVRLNSTVGERQRQNYYLGSYRENIEATAQREKAERAAAVSAEREQRAAERRAAREEAAARKAEAAANTPQARSRAGGFKDQFLYGFGVGDDERPFGEMVGQTARISLFYGAAYRGLSLLQQGLEGAVQETLAYEDALTNLNVVTGRARSSNEGLATALGDIATAAGFNPSQGVELGARAIGLYGVADASREDQDRALDLATRVATQMARVSGADATLTQTQLAGALRSLGWGIERLPELQDTISYISRQTGQAPTELLGAVSNIATLGTQAGFTPQMLAALVAQVGTTTGQNPEATAGQFRQLLSRNASEIAPKASDIVGVDLSGMDLQQIFATVSQLSLSTDQLNRFASLFGKGGSQQVATILTQQYGTVQSLGAQAQDARGYGQEAFERTMDSIGNRLRELGAQVVGFGVKLVESGVVDWIAAMVVAAQNLVNAGTRVLDLFNELPRPIRSIGLALGELYATALLWQRLSTGKAAGALASPFMARASQAVIGAANLDFGKVDWKNLPKSIGDSVSRATRLTGGRGAVVDPRMSANPVLGGLQRRTGLTTLGLGVAAGAALYVAGSVGSSYNTNREAARAIEENRSVLASAQDAASLRNAAAQARNAADELQKQTLSGLDVGDFGSLLSSAFNSMTLGSDISELNKISDKASQAADELDKARQGAALSSDRYFGGDFSGEGIAAGIQAMADSGMTASQQMDVLRGALDRVASGAESTADAVAVLSSAQVPYASRLLARGVSSAVDEASQFAGTRADALQDAANVYFPENPFEHGDDKFRDSQKLLNLSADAQTALTDQLNGVFADLLPTLLSDGVIDDDELAQIRKEAVVEASRNIPDLGSLDPETAEAFRTMIYSRIAGVLRQFSPEAVATDPAAFVQTSLASAEATAGAQALFGGSAVGVATNRLSTLRRDRQTLVNQIATSGTPITGDQINALREFDNAIRESVNNLVDARIARVDQLLAVTQSSLATDDITGRLQAERDAIVQKLDIAREQSNKDAAAAASAAMGHAEWTPVDSSVQDAQIAAFANNERAMAQNALTTRQSQRLSGVWGGDAIGQAAAQIANAQDALSHATSGESAWWDAKGALNQAQYAYTQAVVSRQNAEASAAVAGNRSELVQAQVSIANAQRTLAAQRAGTEPYYNALAQLREAQASLATAELAQSDRLKRLNSDLTDPVEQALLDVKRAQAQLQQDSRSGQGADIIAQDRLDLQGAENQAEAAAFNQRISDLQTNEQLGRITQTAYMSYLQSEHDRLSAIADRTRQQQEQLNQVDQLMKAAADQIQGQWNIGNIELPTIYEVRRAMQSGAPTSVNDYSNSNNTVTVNGADFQAVVEWLQQALGTGARVVTPTSTRRV